MTTNPTTDNLLAAADACAAAFRRLPEDAASVVVDHPAAKGHANSEALRPDVIRHMRAALQETELAVSAAVNQFKAHFRENQSMTELSRPPKENDR